MSFQIKTFTEIVTRMINWITAHTGAITDFNLASSLRSKIEAYAWIIKDILSDIFIAFRDALKNFIYESFEFSAHEALKSGGVVRFTTAIAPVADIDIPVNTIIETDDGIGFATNAAGVLPSGLLTTVDIAVTALVSGADGNVLVTTVINIVTPISGIDSVSNAAAMTGGRNEEAEDDQRERFKKYVKNLARCTSRGIEAGAETVAGVYQAQLVESVTTGGLLFLYVDDGTGTASALLLSDVEDIVEGLGTDEDPGYRAAGTIIQYYAVTTIPVTIVQVIYVKEGANTSDVEAAVELAQTTFVNALKMGKDAVLEKIRSEGSVVLNVTDIEITSPAANVTVNDGEVAKVSSITTTIVEWES